MRAQTGRRRSSVSGLIVAISAAVLAVVALGGWAFGSPVGASADEDYHLVSIWCGLGERPGYCELPSGGHTANNAHLVPAPLFKDASCYAGHPEESAACQGNLDDGRLLLTDRGNFKGDYPPIFYAVMAPFVSGNVEASVIAMRLFNAALFVGFIAVLTWLTPFGRRAVVILPVVATVVPLGMFTIASVSPSSWALLSASTLWICLFNFFEASGWRRWLFAALAVLALVLGAGARADAAAYAGLAVVGVLILKAKATRRFALGAILPVALLVVAVIFYRFSGQSSAATGGLDSLPAAGQFRAELYQDIIMVPNLWTGMLGGWGLGWLDTDMPALVWVASFAVFAGLIFFGLARTGWRKYAAVGLMFAALWAVPTVLQVQSHAPVGNYIQPRYILPLGVLLVGFALVGQRSKYDRLSVAQLVVMIGALGGANALALHTNLRRYLTGVGAAGLNLDNGPEWWWGAGPTPMAVWAIGSLAFLACLAMLGVLYHRFVDARRQEALSLREDFSGGAAAVPLYAAG